MALSSPDHLAVGAGATSAAIGILRSGATVSAVPGSGGTMSVQYTMSGVDAVEDGTATWYTWPLGTVSTATNDTLIGKVTAVRATAATAAGRIEVAQ